MAHAQSIVIRESDFMSARAAGPQDATLVSSAPMRIVPATIGRPDPSVVRSSQGVPPGLLVPRVAPTSASALIAMDQATATH